MAKDILYPLRRLHGIMHDAKVTYDIRKNYRQQFKENPNSVFLIMTPEHGNLGDHAIAIAEKRLLEKHSIRIIEITGKKLDEMGWAQQLRVFNGLPVLFQGGGYLGTLWYGAEKCLRNIINLNSKSPLLFLPNTIYYENNEFGNTEFQESKRIYNKHRNLYLYAREKNSYDIMSEAYKNVKLIPDMVLSMGHYETGFVRHGGILCLRSDCEKNRTIEAEEQIRVQMKQLFEKSVTESDMVVDGSISVDQREAAVEKKFSEFAQAELVVTDRLHGMIFCAVTGTPCIVIDSKSPKLRGCYEWIRHLDYIRFIDEPGKLTDAYYSIPKCCHRYDNSHLKHYFDELACDILEMIKKKQRM